MNAQEATWHYRLWHILILIIILIITLSNNSDVSSKLNLIYSSCASFTIDLDDMEIQGEENFKTTVPGVKNDNSKN